MTDQQLTVGTGGTSMSVSSKNEIVRRLAEYPEGVLPFFVSGFDTASRLSEETLKRVLGELIVEFNRGRRRVSGTKLLHLATDLSERDAEQIASIYSLVIGLLSESVATADEFLEAARGRLFQPEQEATARSIAEAICANRDEINSAVRRAQLAGSVLPSLSTVDIAVDIRVGVTDGRAAMLVPVAVVYIDTDMSDQKLYLQLTRADLEDLVEKLSDGLERMKVAESIGFPENAG